MGAIALAIIAAVLVFVALSNFGEDGGGSSALGGDVDVVIASRDIEPGTTITSDMLEVATVAGQLAIDNAITDRDQLDGFTTLQRVARGEMFAPNKLVEGAVDEDAGLVYTVPQGKRAMAISVDTDKIVGGHVRAGDNVDVVVVFDPVEPEGAPSQDVLVSRVLLQDIEVLAVAENAQEPITRFDEEGNVIVPEDADEAQGLRSGDEDPDPDADTVTLAVNTNDVPLLALAAEGGTVYLALRPVGATDPVDLSTIEGIPTN
jgi:pilus assembly protein CpaB